jgi:hypothetical protein
MRRCFATEAQKDRHGRRRFLGIELRRSKSQQQIISRRPKHSSVTTVASVRCFLRISNTALIKPSRMALRWMHNERRKVSHGGHGVQGVAEFVLQCCYDFDFEGTRWMLPGLGVHSRLSRPDNPKAREEWPPVPLHLSDQASSVTTVTSVR